MQGLLILKESVTLLTLCQFTVPPPAPPGAPLLPPPWKRGSFRGSDLWVLTKHGWDFKSLFMHIIYDPVLEV